MLLLFTVYCPLSTAFIPSAFAESPASSVERDFLEQISKNPNDPTPYYALGLLRLKQNRLLEAEGYFRKVTRLLPNDPHSRSRLAFVLQKQGKKRQARKVREDLVDVVSRTDKPPSFAAIAPARTGAAQMRPESSRYLRSPEPPRPPVISQSPAQRGITIEVKKPKEQPLMLRTHRAREIQSPVPALRAPRPAPSATHSPPSTTPPSPLAVRATRRVAPTRNPSPPAPRLSPLTPPHSKEAAGLQSATAQLEEQERKTEKMQRQIIELEERLKAISTNASQPVTTAPARSVNINNAPQAELETLSGMTPDLAAQIVWFRREVGPFLMPQDILYVPGMSKDIYRQLISNVTLSD